VVRGIDFDGRLAMRGDEGSLQLILDLGRLLVVVLRLEDEPRRIGVRL